MLSITVSNRRQKDETNRALICFFNEKTGKYNIIKENVLPDNLIDTEKYKPFGCYPKGEFLFVANHDKLIKLDRKGEYVSHITLNNFENPHQIIVTDDVKCFTNTDKDLIELTYTDLKELPTKDKKYVIDLKTLDNVKNDLYAGPYLLKDDNHHVNSLCLNDNKIYFCLHNRGSKPSQYFYIDLLTEQIHHICDYGNSSHNCEIEGDFLYTLNTREACLACINLKTGKGWETKLVDEGAEDYLKIDRADYFLRGLVLTKNHFIIGASLTNTNANNGNSQILFVDRETKKIVNRYDIEGYNCVNDIKQIYEIEEIDLEKYLP